MLLLHFKLLGETSGILVGERLWELGSLVQMVSAVLLTNTP